MVDILGGRRGGHEKALRRVRGILSDEMRDNAVECGATELVGMDLGWEVIGDSRRMFMVTIGGTAVLVESL